MKAPLLFPEMRSSLTLRTLRSTGSNTMSVGGVAPDLIGRHPKEST